MPSNTLKITNPNVFNWIIAIIIMGKGVVNLVILVIVAFAVLVSLNLVSAISNVSACGNLSSPNVVYTMNKSINSTFDCITINASNITLDCQGYNITFGNSSGAWGISVSDGNYNGYNNVTIKNCKIYENNSGGGGNTAIYFGASSKNGVVFNTTISTYGIVSYGIYFDNNSVNATISFNNITTTSILSNGIYFVTGARNASIKNNNITSYGLTASAVYFESNSTSANISYNNIATFGNTGYGIEFDANSSKTEIILNNISTFEVNSNVIYFDMGASNASIKSNNITASENDSSGIVMGDNSESATIYANKIVIQGIVSLPIAGVFLDLGTKGINASSNNITAYGIIGVGIWVWGSNNTVEGNTIRTSGGAGMGIYLGNVLGVNLTSNIITTLGNSAYAVYSIMSENASHILYNNVIKTYGNDSHGITFDQNSDNNVSSNNITTFGNASYGMFFNQSHNHILTGNRITTNWSTSYVLYLITSANETIYNNIFNTSTSGSGLYVETSNPSYYNITETAATNIIGRISTGGNFWTNNASTGYSDNCLDADGDFLCDSPYSLTEGTDYLPLTNRSNMLSACSILNREGRVYYLNNSIGIINESCMNITANYVTLNLSGFTLTGNGTGRGINISTYNYSKIAYGTISNFSNAIYISSSSNNAFTDIYITSSKNDAVLFVGADSDDNNFTGLVILSTNSTYYDINFSTEGIDRTKVVDSLLTSYAFTGAGGIVNLEESDFGKIVYLGAVNGSGRFSNLAGIVYIISNLVSINTTGNPGLNKSANITIYGITYTDPKPQYSLDGTTFADCTAATDPACTELSFSGTTFIFNATHFTSFRAAEAYSAPADASSPGGGGSTTTSFWSTTYIITDEQFKQGYTKELPAKSRIRMNVTNSYHYVGVIELTNTSIKINVSSAPQQATFAAGENRKFDVTEDGYYDISITLNFINNSKASITLLSIYEKITGAATEEEQDTTTGAGEEQKSKKSLLWLWISIAVVAAAAVAVLVYFGYNKFWKKRKSRVR